MLQRQLDSMEKQRDYLMKKLQTTKNNLETEKFSLMKDFEMERLDLFKKIEELLVLNDILAGQSALIDMKGRQIDTNEILQMLNPFQFIKKRRETKGRFNFRDDKINETFIL